MRNPSCSLLAASPLALSRAPQQPPAKRATKGEDDRLKDEGMGKRRGVPSPPPAHPGHLLPKTLDKSCQCTNIYFGCSIDANHPAGGGGTPIKNVVLVPFRESSFKTSPVVAFVVPLWVEIRYRDL